MAHIARIENGTVTEVIVVSSCDFGGCDPHLRPDADHSGCGSRDFPEIEPRARAWMRKRWPGDWRLTSWQGRFRGRFAGIGDRYDPDTDQFLPGEEA
jgi:hypothetical protein